MTWDEGCCAVLDNHGSWICNDLSHEYGAKGVPQNWPAILAYCNHSEDFCGGLCNKNTGSHLDIEWVQNYELTKECQGRANAEPLKSWLKTFKITDVTKGFRVGISFGKQPKTTINGTRASEENQKILMQCTPVKKARELEEEFPVFV